MKAIFFEGEVLVLAIIILLFAAAILVRIAFDINEFSAELRFLNREIRRTHGIERKNLKRERRRLWLSLFFPFFFF